MRVDGLAPLRTDDVTSLGCPYLGQVEGHPIRMIQAQDYRHRMDTSSTVDHRQVIR